MIGRGGIVGVIYNARKLAAAILYKKRRIVCPEKHKPLVLIRFGQIRKPLRKVYRAFSSAPGRNDHCIRGRVSDRDELPELTSWHLGRLPQRKSCCVLAPRHIGSIRVQGCRAAVDNGHDQHDSVRVMLDVYSINDYAWRMTSDCIWCAEEQSNQRSRSATFPQCVCHLGPPELDRCIAIKSVIAV